MAIYLKIPEGKKFRSIEELLMYGYTQHGGYINYFTTTYKDKECTIQQCHSNASRSFEDLLEICQTYFPSTTKKRLAQMMYRTFERTKFSPTFCDNIDKVVFDIFKTETKFGESMPKFQYNKKGKGQYSFNDILKLATK